MIPPDVLPPFSRTALMLDLDGTLLDLAPTPDGVVVPPGLVDTLLAIKVWLGGALAVVTGRPIADIDTLLPGVPDAVAGEHGAAIRSAPNAAVVRAVLRSPPPGWYERGALLEAAYPGTVFEPKPRGLGLHFRLAPAAGPFIHQALAELVAQSSDFWLMPGHMMWEIRPRGVDKGDAVAALMRGAPFVGRLPVFIGDDLTDEDGMRVARAMGGAGIRVQDVFGDAAGVRAWLHRTAVRGDWGVPR